MLARITGQLTELDAERQTALIAVDQLAYEVMVPAYAISDLSACQGQDITLHCLEYLEASGGMGGNMIPRCIGFPGREDKAFFLRFTSVKGIGTRKALRAMAKPVHDIASYIEAGDAKMLSTLPEIGRRTAEQVIAELKGKMETYAIGAGGSAAQPTGRPLQPIEQEALDILLQLGEKAPDAERWIGRVTEVDPTIDTTDALVQAVYRIKASAV